MSTSIKIKKAQMDGHRMEPGRLPGGVKMWGTRRVCPVRWERVFLAEKTARVGAVKKSLADLQPHRPK